MLQAKVLKLNKMIAKLRATYPADVLENHPQYQRLMGLYNSLAPLLPEAGLSMNPEMIEEDETSGSGETADHDKRSTMSVDFMGMQVSYPQYLRLVALQAKVVKLDKVMQRMLETRSLDELQKYSKWRTLVALHDSLKKLLPRDYVSSEETLSDAIKRQDSIYNPRIAGSQNDDATLMKRTSDKRSSIAFNGIQMSYPQYWKMMELQKKVLKLDAAMKQIAEQVNDPKQLEKSLKWQELTALRAAMEQLMPTKQRLRKRAATMDFNGVQVRN